MDLSTLANQSPKIMAVVDAVKNDPNFFAELQANPQEALTSRGIELNEEELVIIQKLSAMSEVKEEIEGVFNKLKGFLGFKEAS